MQDIIPNGLKKGDTIAFISPSARYNDIYPQSISRSKSYFESLGFHVKVIFTPLSTDYLTSLKQRAEEFHLAFSDPKIKGVFTTIGGTLGSSLLPYLDWDLIRKNPKVFVGYSDITVFHIAIRKMTGLRTFYGPCPVTELGDFGGVDAFTSEHVQKVLIEGGKGAIPRSMEWSSDEAPFWHNGAKDEKETRKLKPNSGWKWIRPGVAEGELLGGCVHVLLRLTGTKYWIDTRDKILLLETAMGEEIGSPASLERVRSWLADLVNVGAFEGVRGVIVGRPVNWSEVEMESYRGMVGEVVGVAVEGRKVPVLMDVDVGHTVPMLTLPLGARVRIDSGKDSFEILEDGVVL